MDREKDVLPAWMAGYWGSKSGERMGVTWADWRVSRAARMAGERAGWSGLLWVDLKLKEGVRGCVEWVGWWGWLRGWVDRIYMLGGFNKS